MSHRSERSKSAESDNTVGDKAGQDDDVKSVSAAGGEEKKNARRRPPALQLNGNSTLSGKSTSHPSTARTPQELVHEIALECMSPSIVSSTGQLSPDAMLRARSVEASQRRIIAFRQKQQHRHYHYHPDDRYDEEATPVTSETQSSNIKDHNSRSGSHHRHTESCQPCLAATSRRRQVSADIDRVPSPLSHAADTGPLSSGGGSSGSSSSKTGSATRSLKRARKPTDLTIDPAAAVLAPAIHTAPVAGYRPYGVIPHEQRPHGHHRQEPEPRQHTKRYSSHSKGRVCQNSYRPDTPPRTAGGPSSSGEESVSKCYGRTHEARYYERVGYDDESCSSDCSGCTETYHDSKDFDIEGDLMKLRNAYNFEGSEYEEEDDDDPEDKALEETELSKPPRQRRKMNTEKMIYLEKRKRFIRLCSDMWDLFNEAS